MKYEMIPADQYWSEWHSGLHREERKTLVLFEHDGEMIQDFAYVMNGFFDHHRQGGNFKFPIKFVLVKTKHDDQTISEMVGNLQKMAQLIAKQNE